MICTAIEEKDADLEECYEVFEQLEDFKISGTTKKTAKVILAYESSYKGGERLDINFSEIHEMVIAYKTGFRDSLIETYTKLGCD